MLLIRIRGERFYACEYCGAIYDSRDLAAACESWCSQHGSCNVEIISRSVGSLSRVGLRLSGGGPL